MKNDEAKEAQRQPPAKMDLGDENPEVIAYFLTVPALFSIVTYGLSQWVFFSRVNTDDTLLMSSLWSGVLGLFTSSICLIFVRSRSGGLKAWQIFNACWLVYIFYSIVTFGAVGMQH